ncbi:MAG: 3-methyl-2-oxobutanoate hydroxymethyltransferase [Acidobacteriota bacterium]|nr:MAG: 3-methyl-2-oxobutanoate hydroxymethyltransferase [Acidobacteriota bacterium]
MNAHSGDAAAAGAGQRVTVSSIRERKTSERPIAALTAYDYASARLADEAGMDIILVGDSLAMVVLGYENTLPVTVDEMLHHMRAVARGAKRALLVADMPYMSYHASVEEAVRNAGRFVKEGGAQAVKIEGGRKRLPAVRAILDAEVPVMGHIGLTPQSLHRMGGYKVQGRVPPEAQALLDDARALEEAGIFSLVLEGMPRELACDITRAVSIPTIGIGAGPGCGGQILVFHDVLGLCEGNSPKFARRYLKGFSVMKEALERYAEDVRAGKFPSDDESYHSPKGAPLRFPARRETKR